MCSICSMSTPGGSSSKKKGVRGKYKGKNVEEELSKTQSAKLPIEVHAETGTPVGKNGKKFNNMAKWMTRMSIPINKFKWEDVSRADINALWDRLETKFVLPRDNPTFVDYGEYEMSKGLRDWRADCKKKWIQNIEELGQERADMSPPEGVTQEVWSDCIAYWSTDKQKARAAKNKESRGKMKFLGGWGSKPIVSHVVEGANPDTGELPTAVETFQKFHHKGNDWRNEFAQQAYEQMVEIAATQPAPTEDEPEEPAVDPTQYPRDLPVMTQVLGERSRHLRGFGHLPRLKGVGAKRAPATHPSAQPTVTMEQYEALQKKVEEAEQTTQHTRQQYETQQLYLRRFQDQFEYLSRAVPGFNLPPMDLPPLPTPGAGSSAAAGAGSSSQPPETQRNNDDDITRL
ncbi:uncharacterized protein LOC133037918 [Cannabis sativa]|uniref:uncharacterized protein LOC133037918 n=1 Tax=Cannabis sativa TaxID=3483 RepID=UPI0029CA418B|nr:uncharacterized protein LOC133037918 [Cannabis sativa]